MFERINRERLNSEDDAAARERKFVAMTEAPVSPLVLKMAVPTTISMVVTTLYNLVDSVFVGHLSTEATAGIGITLTYMTVVNALGFFLGHGSGNYISRLLGAQKWNDAERIAATGFISALILGTVVAALGLIFIRPMVTLLGATPEIASYAVSYVRYILIATPFLMSSVVMNNQLRHQGNALFSMVGLASGAVLNIALDPLLIYVLDMGVAGASLATLISQVFSWILLLSGTMMRGSVHLKPRQFSPTLHNYKEIAKGGLPSLVRQSLSACATLFLNYAAVRYALPGEEASTVAAFTIVSRIVLFVYSMILGFGQGFQPVCGFNYGARKFDRVLAAYRFTLRGAVCLLCVFSVVMIVWAPQIVALFRSEDAVLVAIGARVLRWQSFVLPTAAVVTITNMLYQNIGKTLPATFLAMMRQGLFFIPIVFVLPRFLGLDGVVTAQALADGLSFVAAVPFAIAIWRNLKAQIGK
ncbi:MAG: MATE family efflux transporter [Bacteroidales bacterium]|nr:MATE family efflux transporter [Bacteroidales bacterium]